MKYGKTFPGIVVIILTVALLTSIFFSVEQVVAETKNLHIGDKKSTVIGCFTATMTFQHVKLEKGQSKTIECVDVYPHPKCKGPVDFCWNAEGQRVFWCNHDNPLTFANGEPMKYGDKWKVICD